MPPSATTLHPEDQRTLQVWVRANTRVGAAPSVIDATLRHTYGVSLRDVMQVTMSDVARSFAQGATLEHTDEIAGGGNEARRNEIRQNDALFREAHPVVDFGARLVGGVVPGMAAMAIPGLAPVAGQVWKNTLRGAVGGAIQGGIAGEGASEKAFSESGADAALGAGIGAGVGAVVGNVASRFGKAGAQRAILQEGQRQLPIAPQEIATTTGLTLQRQSALAPNTSAVADLSDGTREIAALVALDPKAMTTARQVTATRIQKLLDGRKKIGKFYETLMGQVVPNDRALGRALREAQRVVKGDAKLPALDVRRATTEPEIDLGKLQDIRSIIREYASRTQSDNVRRKLTEIRDGLTEWMEQHAPGLRAADSDYAFLTERTEAAQKTLDALARASTAAGKQRIAGAAAGAAEQIPVPHATSLGITTLRTINRLTSRDPKGRAQAILKFFLTPAEARDAAARMELFDAARGFRQPGRGAAGGAASSTMAGAATDRAPSATSKLF